MSALPLNTVLHALRTEYLKVMPPGAQTLVSAGCSGRWYFDWVDQNYGAVTKHIGVEAYSPKPADLPANAVWLPEPIDAMTSVADGTADLVFAGQTVEHLWPAQLAGFLLEARRVLRPDGWLVMDSPNRLITQMTSWHQPQHTAELRVDEIVALTQMAGFTVERVKGLWLCYDRDRHALLPLEPAFDVLDATQEPRAVGAIERPADSFIWWLEARPNDTPPAARAELTARLQAIYETAFEAAISRWEHLIGKVSGYGRNRIVSAGPNERGYLLYGPYVPLLAGKHSAHFYVGLTEPMKRNENHAVLVEVTCEQGQRILAQRWISSNALRAGALTRFDLEFTVKDTIFGVEFRVLTEGRAPVAVRAPVDYLDHQLWAASRLTPSP